MTPNLQEPAKSILKSQSYHADMLTIGVSYIVIYLDRFLNPIRNAQNSSYEC